MSRKWYFMIKQSIKSYYQNTSLHGLKYMIQPNRPLIEKVIWYIILIINMLLTIYIMYLMMDDYKNANTITTLDDTKYHISNVPFPAVAICNVNRISKGQVLIKAKEISSITNVSEAEIIYLMRNFGKLYDYEIENFEEINRLQRIIEVYTHGLKDFNTWMTLLYDISPLCEDTMVKCMWLGEIINCSNIFFVRRTMDGYCCTFNYLKPWEGGFNYSLTDHHRNAKNNLDKTYEINNFEKIYFEGSGSELGLSVVVFSNPDDYFYPLTSTAGFSVKIFNSYDYPDISSGALTEIYIPLKHESFMQINPTTIKALNSLKTIPRNERNCVFSSEGDSAFDKNFYSYSDCISDCKLKSILAICECIPFYIPVLSSFTFSKQICSFSDIYCLEKNKDQWKNIYPKINIEELTAERENSIFCPNCLPSCSFTSYYVQTDSILLADIGKNLLKGLNLSRHSLIHIYSDKEYTYLYKSDISYYWFDIISNFGGIYSLFLGFSLISGVEIFYYFTIRLYRLIMIS